MVFGRGAGEAEPAAPALEVEALVDDIDCFGGVDLVAKIGVEVVAVAAFVDDEIVEVVGVFGGVEASTSLTTADGFEGDEDDDDDPFSSPSESSSMSSQPPSPTCLRFP